MSERDDFVRLLQHAELITLHIGNKKLALGRDLIALLIEGLKRLPETPPSNSGGEPDCTMQSRRAT